MRGVQKGAVFHVKKHQLLCLLDSPAKIATISEVYPPPSPKRSRSDNYLFRPSPKMFTMERAPILWKPLKNI